MRLFCKLWLVRKPTWDDLVVSLAWVLTLGLSSAVMFGSTVGLGKVDAEILPEWQEPL
jgi:putative heme degradation protein